MIAVVVVIPAAAVALSLKQSASYRATAQVLLNRQDLSAALSGTPDTSSSQDPGRYASTQAELARMPAVANTAITEAHVPVSLKSFLADSSVTSSPDSDLLEFEVNHETSSGAQRLVNAYAGSFVPFRRSLDAGSLKRAHDDVAARLRSLAQSGDRRSALHRDLAAKEQELRALQAVQTAHAILVRTADTATKTQPKPVRDGLLALVLAVILGVTLAFVVQALDTRVGSAVEIAEALKLPLLARLPRPPRHLLKQNRIVMIAEPHSAAAEPFRLLRTNLELANIDRDARMIMVVSAVQEEGKSTTVANLAVAAARAGKRVVLVDLDLRRGDVDQLFGIVNQPGITDVALGRMSVADAVVPIEISPDGTREATGSLHLLPAGHLPPSAGEIAASARVVSILSDVADLSDLVLIDAPPFLQVGDATALSAWVDGLVVVTPLDVRRPMVDEMRRVLEQFRTVPLGVVVTRDDFDQSYAGYSPTRSRDSEIHDPVG